eukprot:TRINITY_DN3947_c2_g1_i1.p1 TRINITY_DN3947_c2_g1~~TRINITY_DN3947_c2_g1_i1.p1  ORF type:complete len:470 (+),score=105.21 TRINITY_DN3947_c2_g1_i1:37-1410(+)
MAAMTDDGSGVMERQIEGLVKIHKRGKDKYVDILKDYDVEKTVEEVKRRGAQRVALQMPDELLRDATAVQKSLRERCEGVLFVVMADTVFAPCCVDEVTAEHINADLILKYGHSCFTATSRTPVHFVPYHLYSNNSTRPANNSNTTVHINPYNVPSHENLSAITPFIVSGVSIPLTCEEIIVESHDNDGGVLQQCCLWEEYRSISGQPGTVVCNSDELDNVRRNVKKRLRQRMFLIEKVKDVEVIAIVVASLAIKDYAKTVEYLKRVITASGKQYVVVYVGKLNVPKLTNYEEVDLYCVIACPQSTWFDTKEYPKGVVTPMEVSAALCEIKPEFDNGNGPMMHSFYYSLELEAAMRYFDSDTMAAVDDDISLITGAVRALPKDETDVGDDEATHTTSTGTVITYSQKQLVAFQESPLVSRLHQRNYQGLEANTGETPVQDEIAKGLTGIASGYANEK